ncbi:hypothetical protein RIR_jg16334.t1 [Rhizophagus irregularis DAOM 181602=DAOM 197198]|nr:hypothetical protein RIR_jg16334.t1 [Rhizophagus irregularis DAOM 181602=DAOM 197198]
MTLLLGSILTRHKAKVGSVLYHMYQLYHVLSMMPTEISIFQLLSSIKTINIFYTCNIIKWQVQIIRLGICSKKHQAESISQSRKPLMFTESGGPEKKVSSGIWAIFQVFLDRTRV